MTHREKSRRLFSWFMLVGIAVLYSTYLGGSDYDAAAGIAVDSSGNAYLTGLTSSTNFPAANPSQPVNAGGVDAFITKIETFGLIPAQERTALIDLYNSTNGPNWSNRTNWLGAAGTECTWYGVTCNGSQSNVESLNLSDNGLNGTIPSSISSLTSLQYLVLLNNQLSGAIPSSIGSLTSLQTVFLSNNQLSGSIPSSIGSLTSLQSLELSFNQLSGIPSSIGSLTSLQVLRLSNNRLSGSIPSSIGSLTSLRQLYLDSNQLSGSIPSSIGDLTSLQYLVLEGNQLSGTIPSSIGSLTSLLDLILPGNQLSGPIPSSIGSLTNLQRLGLGSNQLGGSIPTELANLSNLTLLNLGYNALYTSNSALLSFLDSKNPGWQNTQTIAPSGLSAAAQSTSSVQVSWTPIVYIADFGRYQVFRSTTSGGPYSLAGSTLNKAATGLLVTGLSSATTYYFVVQTVTDPHVFNTQNAVSSEFSSQISAATGNGIPTITSLNPPSATAGGPAFTLTVNGSNFIAASEVRWNGTARSTICVSATQLTAAIPAADIVSPGMANVTVFNPAPGGGTSAPATFTINNPVPTITSLNPSSATAGGSGFTLTVNGTNFVSSATVQWNRSARTTTFVNARQVTAAITAVDIAFPGTAKVTVFNPAPGGGTSVPCTFTIKRSNPVPTITSLNPPSARAGGAAFTLTVIGTNFVNRATVHWNNAPRKTTFVSATQLTATITAADLVAHLTASISVVNPRPGGGASATFPFTVSENNPVPVITSFTPTSAVAGAPGFDVAVNGSNFLADSQVQWNGNSLATIFLSSKQLRGSIPAYLLVSASTAILTVNNPAPGGGPSNQGSFAVAAPVPVITALNPLEVLAGNPAFDLIVYGSDFLPGASVQWNGSNRNTRFESGTELVASIPAADIASPSTVSITAANPGGSPSNSRSLPIVTLAPGPPLITSLDPGAIASGGPAFTLTVNGIGFISGAIVRWNGSHRNTTFVSATELRAAITAPDIATGTTFGVTVVNPATAPAPNPQDPSVSSNTSTVSVLNPVPVLLGFSPDSSPAGSSSMSLTANGVAFVASTRVRFNGEDRNTAYVNSSQLQSIIAATDLFSEGTGVVTVSSPGPGGGSSSKTFTIVSPSPSLTRLYFPRLSSCSTDPNQKNRETTGIALANFDVSGKVTLRALNPQGTAITGERLISPVTLNLDREQLPITDTQLFGSELAAQNSLGWLKAESTVRKLLGFFLVFNDDLSVLDGTDVSSTTLTSFVFPEIEDQGFTQLHAANPDTQAATLTFELYKVDGTLRTPAVTRTVNPNGALAQFFTDLFPGIGTPAASDYLRVTSTRGVVPYEFLGKRGQYIHGVNGQDAAKGARVLYSPQYVLQASVWRTALSVVNLEATAGTVTFRFIGENGVQLGIPRDVPIAAKGKIYITDPKFFLDAGSELVQGYVEVTSSGPRLSGSVVFGDPGRSRFSSALPLVSTLVKDAVFGQVASSNVWFTGIALLNPNALEAHATIDVLDRKGNLVQTKSEIIPAKGRRSQLLTQCFEDLREQVITSGFIRVTVDREIAAFALFGKNDLSALSAIPPQVVP